MLLGSRRLAKAFSMEKDEKNEKIAFSNMINTLQVMHFFYLNMITPVYAESISDKPG